MYLKEGDTYFCDEANNYNDTEIGIKAILLLEKLGYEVIIPEHGESGRAWLSKGLVRAAKEIANKNIELLIPLVSDETPLISVEPSAILTFRDEYPDLATDQNLEKAYYLKRNAFMVDEFIAREIELGNISRDSFTKEKRKVVLAWALPAESTIRRRAFCKNVIITGELFCGNNTFRMLWDGGIFWLRERAFRHFHADRGLVLFPAVQKQSEDTIIACAQAPVAGTRSKMERERKRYIPSKFFTKRYLSAAPPGAV